MPDSTSALVDQLAGDRRIEVREIDDTTPYPPYDVPYLVALERHGRFAREPRISTLEIPASVGARGLDLPATLIVVAAARETLEHFFTAPSAEALPASTHALRYGLTPWRVSPEAEPELWWRAYVVRVDSGFVADGEVRVSAEEGRGELGGRAVVVELDRDAAMRYGAFTRDHIGKRVALIVGGLVFGDPIILEPIENGRIYLNVEQHTDVRNVAARLGTRLGQ